MGTITQHIAEEIMAGGYRGDNPSKIVIYRNMFDGGPTYAVIFAGEDQQKYERSPACYDVRTVWKAP